MTATEQEKAANRARIAASAGQKWTDVSRPPPKMKGFGLMDEAEISILAMFKDRKYTNAERRGALVEEILNRFYIKTMDGSHEILLYKDGIYQRGGEERILNELQTIVEYELTNHMISEVLSAIRRKTGYRTLAEFDNYPGWTHVGNGWLNHSTREFKEHSPEMLSLAKIPWEYRPEARNPEQKKFFADVVEPEDLEPVQKFFGYLLLPDNRFKKAFVLVGPKDTGKSTFLTLVERFVGQVSHVSLHDMAAYNHTVASITQSIVNTTSELPKYKLKDVSLFKSITGNDERTFREIYGKPFTATVRSKFVMASNGLPDFDGMDQTFMDRWILFEFSNIFKKGEDMDVNILDRITTPEEMSGLLNYALDGLTRLLQDGYFKDETYEEHKAKWSTITSKIADYKKDHLVFKEGAMIPRAVLYEDYKSKVKDPLSVAIFGREIDKLGISSKQVRLGGKRVRVYEGVTVKDVTGVTWNFGTVDGEIEKEEKEEDNTEFPVTGVTEGQNPMMIKCPYCGVRYSSRELVIKHAVKAHPGRPVTADLDKLTSKGASE